MMNHFSTLYWIRNKGTQKLLINGIYHAMFCVAWIGSTELWGLSQSYGREITLWLRLL